MSEWAIQSLMAGVIFAGMGIYGLSRARQIAGRNRAFIDSGKEAYFEQRRAWEHYPSQRPIADPDKIRRSAWFSLMIGSLFLAGTLAFLFFASE